MFKKDYSLEKENRKRKKVAKERNIRHHGRRELHAKGSLVRGTSLHKETRRKKEKCT